MNVPDRSFASIASAWIDRATASGRWVPHAPLERELAPDLSRWDRVQSDVAFPNQTDCNWFAFEARAVGDGDRPIAGLLALHRTGPRLAGLRSLRPIVDRRPLFLAVLFDGPRVVSRERAIDGDFDPSSFSMRSSDGGCQLLQGSAARWRSGLPPALADFYASNTPAFAVRACLADFELELFLRPRKDPVTYGEGGSPSLPSQSRTVIRYVQRPRLDLVGTLRRSAHGEWGPVRVLRGAATQDRHWMTVRELDLKWTWMMARLDDGRECMAYELRRGSGGRTKPPSQGDRVGGGAWLVDRDGAVRRSARWDLAVGPEDDAPTSRGPVPGRVELTMPELEVNLVVAPRQLTFVPTRALGELVDAGIWESPGRLVRGPCSGADFWIDYMPPWGGA